MEIRKIKENEKEQASKIGLYSFRDWTDEETKEEDLSFYNTDEVIGVFEKNELKSVLINITFDQIVRGTIKSLGGVSHVGTFPESRKKGYVKELMKTAFQDMKDKNQSVSMLQPFRESFYGAYGYITTNHHIEVKIPIEAIKHYAKQSKEIEGNWQEKRFDTYKTKIEYMDFGKKISPKLYHGNVFPVKINDKAWKVYNKNLLTVFIYKDNEICAMSRYAKKGVFATGELIVIDMFWKDEDSRVKLFNYFAKHIDQIKTIQFRYPFGLNFFTHFRDLMHTIELKMMPQAWMVRIIDIVEAFKDIEVKTKDRMIFKIHDEYCIWNNGIFKLESDGKKLKAEKLKDSNEIDFESSIKGISSILYGGYSINDLIYNKEIKLINENIKELIDNWFPNIPLHNPTLF